MADSSAQFHEDPEVLSSEVKDRHRAIVSLMEELEAVDWYDQRVQATEDAELAGLLAHNRDEEKEHAAMLIEWLRRNDAGFATQLKTYLFTSEPILEVEEGGGEPAASPGSLSLGGLKNEEGL